MRTIRTNKTIRTKRMRLHDKINQVLNKDGKAVIVDIKHVYLNNDTMEGLINSIDPSLNNLRARSTQGTVWTL